MTNSLDAFAVGSGQAGPFLAARLAQAGMKTALVEREYQGGTCVNDGCIPTMTLIASARSAQVARLGADYGVDISGPVRVDMKAVKARRGPRRRAVEDPGLHEGARRRPERAHPRRGAALHRRRRDRPFASRRHGRADASYKVIERAVHIHPMVSELIPTLHGDLVPLPGSP